ncbi:MAG: hypothetical protein EP335_00405 [Alphaproteobacteria bacterium]|nr:MAG: hypothetical protein EP335_00405 [Alphaproteobacteria bacterium]
MSKAAAKRVFLHIGRHKCGTSTLQHFLSGNDARLAELGFHYPRGLRAPVAHHPLAYWFNDAERDRRPEVAGVPLDDAVAAFWREIAAAPGDIIVSSEAFQNIDPARASDAFAGFELDIIVYLREPLDYLLSAYAQRIKGGGSSETLDTFVDRFRPDYADFLDRWQAAFPAARLQVRLFERARLDGADIRRDFLSCLGLPGTAIDGFAYPDTDNNVSIGGPLLEFMRRLNLHGLIDPACRNALYRACQALALANPAYRTRPALPAEMQQAIRARHADSVARVSERYLDQGGMFTEKVFPVGPICHALAAREGKQILDALRNLDPELAESLAGSIGAGRQFFD